MATRVKPYIVQSHGRSDIGLVRDNNEDAWLADSKNNIFVLCDGMGGHSAGEVASQEAVASFSKLVKKIFGKKTKFESSHALKTFKHLIKEVNDSVYRLGQKDREFRGMGTTLCCVYFCPESMIVGHVGDSRVYLHRENELQQLTEDHSLVSELMELGELNSRQAREYAYRNIITRAIGAEAEVEPSVQQFALEPGDQILMCSDGLSDMLALREIEMILNMNKSLEHTIDRLINKAMRKGGYDNITAVLMKIEESHDQKDLPRS